MKSFKVVARTFLFLSLFVTEKVQASCCNEESCAQFGNPPFRHTCDFKDAITPQRDPTVFTGLTYTGEGTDHMWEADHWIDNEPVHVYTTTFSDGRTITVHCQTKAGSVDYCQKQATLALTAIGRIPEFARYTIKELEIISEGVGFWGGGGTITFQIREAKENDPCIEELFMHECGHNMFDPLAYGNDIWNCARDADRDYITPYGQQNPFREDAADSLVAYYGWYAGTVSSDVKAKIQATIPNRLEAIPKIIWGKEFVPDNSTFDYGHLAGLYCTLRSQ